MNAPTPARDRAIGLVGFDGDDTLWKSEDYYRKAEQDYLQLLSNYIDVHDTETARHLLDVQRRNLGVFGYGVKAMTLSMIEAAIDITAQRISAKDIQTILDLGHATLRHPVELIDGVRESVARIAADYPVVLITKGDLFHQEAKIEIAQLHDLFPRIEIVSEKDPQTYARVLAEFDLPMEQFVMVGNSLRSDIEPVVTLGGWGIHTPYAVTWAHETEHGVADDEPRMVTADTAWQWPEALAAIEAKAQRALTDDGDCGRITLMNLLRPLLFSALCASPLLLPALASAQQTAERSAVYEVDTGRPWLDTRLADINHYAERYPDSFLDELSRYSGVPRAYAAALINTHGWQAADVYFACFWAKAIEVSCRESVRAFTADPEGGWEAVVRRLPVHPEPAHWQAMREAVEASYKHWDRPAPHR